ncbi:helix-turn-helix domain-containing protein [Brevundimonas sp.]|uniref:helix-turn-helix domain-containing protein n=1 Tax=Brevundimonas sp. TaxID=1871086 RepID=UPI00344F9DDB
MAQKPRKSRPAEVYEEYRARSGWYLAAWRDYAGLTLEDLADELGRSKGYISDLETGATRTGRPPTRFNRDLVEQVALVVHTTGGRLIDVNPFTAWEGAEQFEATIRRLGPEDRQAVIDMAERLASRLAS